MSSAGTIVTGFRTMLIAIAAGAVTAAGLWYTHKKHELDADGQVSDRYVEAVKLLGSESVHLRLGGSYSFERIMKDSDRDHPTIVDVLSAFIRTKLNDEERAWEALMASDERERSNVHGRSPKIDPEAEPGRRTLSQEIQAALAVLNRRTEGD